MSSAASPAHKSSSKPAQPLKDSDFSCDDVSMSTRAQMVAGCYKLNGHKIGISTAQSAELAIIWAKRDGKIRGLIVERATKGFSTPKVGGKLSWPTSVTGEILLEDAFV